MTGTPAPELDVIRWFNAAEPLSLAGLRGKVVVLHAFQMLCPGCVGAGLPQAKKIAATFPPDEVAVIGLHTVFEHHEAMTPVSLAAFIHEYRLGFPIAVDRPGGDGPIPHTMAAYGMRGTPSLVLIDRAGMIRRHAFGAEDDMKVGAEIAWLMKEGAERDE
ncbi:MAG: redoxin domain-containing protein [Aquamicrobium sp.]|uniref:redoxin domain-containing protein n=1 Tax=Aquamicrobium sp. TaxID=1872579 RepID=UPI00349E99B4|nr:redoxin domain-containing protein [Aquamicrobium sp.]